MVQPVKKLSYCPCKDTRFNLSFLLYRPLLPFQFPQPPRPKPFYRPFNRFWLWFLVGGFPPRDLTTNHAFPTLPHHGFRKSPGTGTKLKALYHVTTGQSRFERFPLPLPPRYQARNGTLDPPLSLFAPGNMEFESATPFPQLISIHHSRREGPPVRPSSTLTAQSNSFPSRTVSLAADQVFLDFFSPPPPPPLPRERAQKDRQHFFPASSMDG